MICRKDRRKLQIPTIYHFSVKEDEEETKKWRYYIFGEIEQIDKKNLEKSDSSSQLVYQVGDEIPHLITKIRGTQFLQSYFGPHIFGLFSFYQSEERKVADEEREVRANLGINSRNQSTKQMIVLFNSISNHGFSSDDY